MPVEVKDILLNHDHFQITSLFNNTKIKENYFYSAYRDHSADKIDNFCFIWMRFYNNETDFTDIELRFESETQQYIQLLQKLNELKESNKKSSAA